MQDLTSIVATLGSLGRSMEKLEEAFATSIVGVARKVLASVRAFLRREVTPQGIESFE
jgi:hypothetical protein